MMQGGREFQKETATTLIHRESLRDYVCYCFLSNFLFCYKLSGYEIDFSKFLQCGAGWERISKRKLQQHSFIASPFVTWHGPFFKVEIFTISMADPLICSDPR